MNQKIKRIFLVFLLITLSSLCFGEQISFQVVQHNKSVDNVSEEALVVEDALISSFFDSGYIVTNSLASLSKNSRTDKKLWKIGVEEAVEGGSDYFVQVILHFTQKEGPAPKQDIMILESVEYNLSDTDSLKVKAEGKWDCHKEIMDSDDINEASDILISELYKVLKA